MSSSVSECVVEGAEGDLATGMKEDDFMPTDRVPREREAATPDVPVTTEDAPVTTVSLSSLESHTTFPNRTSLCLHPSWGI